MVHALGPDGKPVAVPAPLGVVLVSQTCDVVLPGRPAVQVARRVRLPDAQAAQARDGKRPRFAHLPQLGQNDFADLDVISTIAKSRLVELTRAAGVLGDEEGRRFAGAVARKFGRFAFPDEVTPWLKPLEEVVASKARKSASPEGRALEAVVELRVEAVGGWSATPYNLTLCVIVQPGTLPAFPDDDFPDLPPELATWLYEDEDNLRRSSGEIADRLGRTVEAEEKQWLWTALGEAWAGKCRPAQGCSEAIHDAVASVLPEVVPADEFTLTRVRRSEILDLDHLSGPTPELG